MHVRVRVPVTEILVMIRANPRVLVLHALPRAGKHVARAAVHGNLPVEIHARLRANPRVWVRRVLQHAIRANPRVRRVKHANANNLFFFYFCLFNARNFIILLL